NATPTKKQIEYCRPNLNRTIKQLKPKVIIPLGGTAVQAVLAPIWKEAPGSISKWTGWNIPSQELNAWVCPTFHPSYVIRELSDKNKRVNPVPELMFLHQLETAVEHE